MIGSLSAGRRRDDRVLVGPETADDAGVFALGDDALVATADFITPVCDDPYRYGWVAAANSMSDVFAMGGEVLFALNLCCFPENAAAADAFSAILRGANDALAEAGGVLLGGHSVRDPELKFGLAVIGRVDPARVLPNSGAQEGQHLILTKPLGTGVLLNAFKVGKLGESELEPVLSSMERLSAEAARLASEHGATGCTDITGFGIVGHGLEMARASDVAIRVRFADIPVYEGFYEMARRGISTGSTRDNQEHVAADFRDVAGLAPQQQELLFDPQTSGGLLISIAAENAPGLVEALEASGHRGANIGEVAAGPARFEVV